MRRNPHRLMERLGKMELAHEGHLRELLKRQRFVEVRVNVLDRAAQLRPMRAEAAHLTVHRSGIVHEDMRRQCRSEAFSIERGLRIVGAHLAVEGHAKGTDQGIGDGELRHDLGVVQPGFTVRDFAEDEGIEKNRRQFVLPLNRGSPSQRGGRDRHSILTDVFGHHGIADFLPHANRTVDMRKKDGQLWKPELYGLRGAGHPVSVNFDSCPVPADAGRVGERSGDPHDLLFRHHSHHTALVRGHQRPPSPPI
jgi:hypothetical protein